MSKDPVIPGNFNESTKDILRSLLKKEIKNRLGGNGADEIKNHAYFKETDWQSTLRKTSNVNIVSNFTTTNQEFDFSDRPSNPTPSSESIQRQVVDGEQSSASFTPTNQEFAFSERPRNPTPSSESSQRQVLDGEQLSASFTTTNQEFAFSERPGNPTPSSKSSQRQVVDGELHAENQNIEEGSASGLLRPPGF